MKHKIKFKSEISRDQEVLIPRRIEDYVDENHIVKLIVIICKMLDLSKIISKYSSIGQHAYNPAMMVAILFYGYATGIRSSRKLADACKHRMDFIYITQWFTPSHDRISNFRKDNLEELKGLFEQIVIIGNKIGLVKIGNLNVCIDGTKIRANASAKLTKDEKGLEKLMEDTKEVIANMFAEAEKIDKEEDEKYGKQNSGTELKIPKELQSAENRKKAVEKVIKYIEAVKEKIHEKQKTNVQEKEKNIEKLIKNIQSEEARAEKIEDAFQRLKAEKEEKKSAIKEEKGRELTEIELKKIEKTKINVTDHDAKFMKERNGIIKPEYNAQIAVDEENQFIVANNVTTECNDTHQLIPMVQRVKDTTGHTPKHATGDNGYISQLEDAIKLFPGTCFLVDDKVRRRVDIDLDKIMKEYSEAKRNNLAILLSDEGERKYKKRMYTVEPPFGDLKFNKGYRHFLLRGLEKAKGEFNLMCIGYNLKKIYSFLTRTSKHISYLVKALTNKIVCGT